MSKIVYRKVTEGQASLYSPRLCAFAVQLIAKFLFFNIET